MPFTQREERGRSARFTFVASRWSFQVPHRNHSSITAPNMRYLLVKRLAFLLTLVMIMASCASNNGMVRKCNGKRGERVPMGVL